MGYEIMNCEVRGDRATIAVFFEEQLMRGKDLPRRHGGTEGFPSG